MKNAMHLSPIISLAIPRRWINGVSELINRYGEILLAALLTGISIVFFLHFYLNGLGLSYNDARSHLDIGRRVVEGLKPGLAQLGSVWLPLPHILMVPTIWNDFMWHTGLSGALVSMISFVATGLIIFLFLKRLGVGRLGQLVGVSLYVANMNVLYLQSTAMTELLLMATMTAGAYELLSWASDHDFLRLIKSAFWIMLSTLVRYDGWFLFVVACALILGITLRKQGYKVAEGTVVLFATLAGVGIAFWFLWNALIFKDPFYFAFGPFSARAQQQQLEQAGVLETKGNLWFSMKVYLFALAYNAGAFTALAGVVGAVVFWLDRKIDRMVRISTLTLVAPFAFNVLALYLGHSVLFIQGLSGGTWFNARYGAMVIPAVAVFVGYLVHRLTTLRWVVIGLLAFVTFFAIRGQDAVTIDDARVGSSQKNVSEVSGWLAKNAKNEKGFILISAASHDAIIFSSGLPMKRFIHEGTGAYWESALAAPDRWARWIVMRTHDDNDLVFKDVQKSPGFSRYDLVAKYPFADVYQLQSQYLDQLTTEPVFGKQK